MVLSRGPGGKRLERGGNGQTGRPGRRDAQRPFRAQGAAAFRRGGSTRGAPARAERLDFARGLRRAIGRRPRAPPTYTGRECAVRREWSDLSLRTIVHRPSVSTAPESACIPLPRGRAGQIGNCGALHTWCAGCLRLRRHRPRLRFPPPTGLGQSLHG